MLADQQMINWDLELKEINEECFPVLKEFDNVFDLMGFETKISFCVEEYDNFFRKIRRGTDSHLMQDFIQQQQRDKIHLDILLGSTQTESLIKSLNLDQIGKLQSSGSKFKPTIRKLHHYTYPLLHLSVNVKKKI
jgi:hypothetical protein